VDEVDTHVVQGACSEYRLRPVISPRDAIPSDPSDSDVRGDLKVDTVAKSNRDAPEFPSPAPATREICATREAANSTLLTPFWLTLTQIPSEVIRSEPGGRNAAGTPACVWKGRARPDARVLFHQSRVRSKTRSNREMWRALVPSPASRRRMLAKTFGDLAPSNAYPSFRECTTRILLLNWSWRIWNVRIKP